MARPKKTISSADRQRPTQRTADVPQQPAALSAAWLFGGVGFGALIIAFILYSPALGGPFLFDDFGLPFYMPTFAEHPVSAWLAGVRPMLMLSYWINFQMSGREPAAYHAINLLLHVANSVLVFLFISRILRLRPVDPKRAILSAAIAASIFLVHPIQTEAVAYIAGRSELVCGFFILATLVVFSRPAAEAVNWRTAIVILLLYGLAVLSKVQAVVLPVAFLVIDIVLRGRTLRETLRTGWRIYAPIAILGVVAVVGVLGLLARSSTAGFNVAGMKWYEYLFTQFRVWLLYLRLTVFPFGQNADYDIALSRSLTEHGSALALIALLIGAFIAWRFRARFPLLFAGVLIFAVLLAPTSSLIPIQDLAAERRMYEPLLGLLLVLTQALVRVNLNVGVTTGLVAFLLICSALTYERAKVWGSDVAFWSDTVSQSPAKPRGYTHLVYAYIHANRCSDAVKAAQRAPEGIKDTPEFLGMLGHAYTCEMRIPEAVTAFERAVQVGPGVGRYLALASSYRRAGRFADADAAEEKAMKIPPRTAYDFTMLDALKRTQTRSRALGR
jgi:tetratricopeptide (TPR) repeat protein